MDQRQEVKQLAAAGFFRDAFLALEKLPRDVDDKLSVQVLRAELLERIGRTQEAATLIRRALTARNISASDRSLCEFVLARIAVSRGDTDAAIAHLAKAIGTAKRAGDLERTCTAQLKLLLVLSDGAGPEASGPLLAEVRSNAIKTGNPRMLAALHVYFAQIEGFRSSVNSSRRHIRLAQRLLADSPNVWLEAIVSNIELCLCLMASEFEAAKEHARVGRELSERSGGVVEFAVNQANAGYLSQVLGDFDDAVDCYERAARLFIPNSDNYNGAIDSLARVLLAQNRLDECEELLAQIDQSDLGSQRRATYVHRHIQFTRARLWARKGNFAKANGYLELCLRMAREAGDVILTALSLIEKGELLIAHNMLSEVTKVIDDATGSFPEQSAEVYARYERLLGNAAAASGELGQARRHLERAERVYLGLHHKEGLSELRACAVPLSGCETQTSSAYSLLQSVVGVLAHFKHPEFVALELVDILVSTGRFDYVGATLRTADGSERMIAEHGATDVHAATKDHRRLHIGRAHERSVDVLVQLKQDAESLATFHAAATLIADARELKTARDDRNERATIWPVDDRPVTETHGVISGHMRELMTYAQRVARTTVNVLITGESGTGKEVLARAVHDFSDRAQKPFIPFNCAAVPRDLLESQLFGHRRGAFTGAERDQPGLVRSAAGGTLFLDEVGEMSLDLQPKLLRFLESGEIAPLGEPAPINVQVRILAATNANLEDAVRDGRFREDLFYRLNVVNLSIKPLRERRDEIPGLVNHFVDSAAREFKKGHLQVSEDTMERLLLYRWPGNVRQLQNEIRRMVALAEPNSTLEPDSISAAILGAMPNLRQTGVNTGEIAIPLHDKLLPTLSRIEYEMIKAALREHQGKVDPAAKSLGISRKGLYLKRQRLGL